MQKMKGFGTAVAVMLGLAGAASLMMAYSEYQAVMLLSRDPNLILEDLTGYIYESLNVANFRNLATITLGCVLLLNAVFFLMWFHRGTKNLWIARLPNLPHSPGWAVGGWFIPIYNYYKVIAVSIQLWKGSVHHGRGNGDGNWRQESLSPLVLVWSIGFFVSSMVGQVAATVNTKEAELETNILAEWMGFGSSLLAVVSVVAGIIMVLKISAMQDQGRLHLLERVRFNTMNRTQSSHPSFVDPMPGATLANHPQQQPHVGMQPIMGPGVQRPAQAQPRPSGAPMTLHGGQGGPMPPQRQAAPSPRPGVTLPTRRPMK